VRSNLSFTNVYKKASIKSGIVTQLLYGDQFKVLERKKSWLKIKNELDHYKGYIKNNTFLTNQKSTHKINKLSADLYIKPNLKKKN
tara:strand:+ start:540 stop:797 length:258 start_codon:yes stop_codon:yes gene_type:complete